MYVFFVLAPPAIAMAINLMLGLTLESGTISLSERFHIQGNDGWGVPQIIYVTADATFITAMLIGISLCIPVNASGKARLITAAMIGGIAEPVFDHLWPDIELTFHEGLGALALVSSAIAIWLRRSLVTKLIGLYSAASASFILLLHLVAIRGTLLPLEKALGSPEILYPHFYSMIMTQYILFSLVWGFGLSALIYIHQRLSINEVKIVDSGRNLCVREAV